MDFIIVSMVIPGGALLGITLLLFFYDITYYVSLFLALSTSLANMSLIAHSPAS